MRPGTQTRPPMHHLSALLALWSLWACHPVSPGEPCREVECSGHGQCVEDPATYAPRCLCEEGFRTSGLECLEDDDPGACTGEGEEVDLTLPEPGRRVLLEGETTGCEDGHLATCAISGGAPDLRFAFELASRRTLIFTVAPEREPFEGLLLELLDAERPVACSRGAELDLRRSLDPGSHVLVADGEASQRSGAFALELFNAPRPGGFTFPPAYDAEPTEEYGCLTCSSNIGDHLCSEGNVIIGFQGRLRPGDSTDETVHAQLRSLCGTPSVVVERSGQVDTYSVAVAMTEVNPRAPDYYGEHGDPDYFWERICPPEAPVVVGFSGSTTLPEVGFPLIGRLQLRCAELLIEGDDDRGYTLRLGEEVDLEPSGAEDEVGTAFDWTLCAAGSVAIGTQVIWGWYIDAFGLYCAPPALEVDGEREGWL